MTSTQRARDPGRPQPEHLGQVHAQAEREPAAAKGWNERLFPREWPLAHYEMSFLMPHLLREKDLSIEAYFTRVYNPVWTNPDGCSWIEMLEDEHRIGCHVALTPIWSETASAEVGDPCLASPWAYPASAVRSIRRADPEIERRWLEQIRAIATRVLRPYDVDLYLFGSRALGEGRVASDIDLALDPKGEIPLTVLARLEEEFDESTVPVEVDLVDLRSAGEALRAKARREGIRWIASKSA